jgi:hypothetical protein
MYKDHSVEPYDALYYNAKAKVITSVAPGVVFYFSTVVAPAADFDIIIQQDNTEDWNAILVHDEANNPAVYSYADCSMANFGDIELFGDGTAKVSVYGAVPGDRYIVATKYSPQDLVGMSLDGTTQSDYLFNTVVDVFNGADADIWVMPKEKGGGKPPKATVYISLS